MKLIEPESCASLSLKILECGGGKICPEETVTSLGSEGEGKEKNPLVTEKGIYSLCSL